MCNLWSLSTRGIGSIGTWGQCLTDLTFDSKMPRWTISRSISPWATQKSNKDIWSENSSNKNNLENNQSEILVVINLVIWYHMIRITLIILEFCPDLSQRVYPDRNLLITRRTSPEDEDESSKQRDDEHHASNQSTTILDEHKNLCSNFIQ
jgi:hypothetical protein